MKLVFAIRDRKAEALIGGLILVNTENEAIRLFKRVLVHEVEPHWVVDYELLQLGELDEFGCTLKEFAPKVVCSGLAVEGEVQKMKGELLKVHGGDETGVASVSRLKSPEGKENAA